MFSETYDAAVPRDALGRVQRKIDTVNGATSTWDYTYDLAGRLKTVQLNGSPYETYSYDDNGNRLSVVKPSGTTSATYDDQDRLLTFGPWTYAYTPNGELLAKSNAATGQTWAYVYDVLGNLKRVHLPTGDVIEYLVDGKNRRVGKKRNGLLTKQWLYHDQLHPVAELDGSGSLVSRFVWASGNNVPDLVVSSGVTYRVYADHTNSPRVLVNAASGAVAATMRHDAWGIVLEDSTSALMPFGFAGGLYDAETGLVRFGARDYDPQIGRWVSKDPIRFEAGQANIYVYVGNDPVNFVDPTGLDGFWSDVWNLGVNAVNFWWDPIKHWPLDLVPGSAINSTGTGDPGQCSEPPKDRCYEIYLEQTAYCGSMWTDDYRYDICMDNAWKNLWRCRNGLPPKPLVPIPPR